MYSQTCSFESTKTKTLRRLSIAMHVQTVANRYTLSISYFIYYRKILELKKKMWTQYYFCRFFSDLRTTKQTGSSSSSSSFFGPTGRSQCQSWSPGCVIASESLNLPPLPFSVRLSLLSFGCLDRLSHCRPMSGLALAKKGGGKPAGSPFAAEEAKYPSILLSLFLSPSSLP